MAPAPEWWAIRPARNAGAASYTCPFCGRKLHAAVDHALVAPEGDGARRRHAHLECVARERAAGRLPSRDDRRRSGPPLLARLGLLRRGRSEP